MPPTNWMLLRLLLLRLHSGGGLQSVGCVRHCATTATTATTVCQTNCRSPFLHLLFKLSPLHVIPLQNVASCDGKLCFWVSEKEGTAPRKLSLEHANTHTRTANRPITEVHHGMRTRVLGWRKSSKLLHRCVGDGASPGYLRTLGESLIREDMIPKIPPVSEIDHPNVGPNVGPNGCCSANPGTASHK